MQQRYGLLLFTHWLVDRQVASTMREKVTLFCCFWCPSAKLTYCTRKLVRHIHRKAGCTFCVSFFQKSYNICSTWTFAARRHVDCLQVDCSKKNELVLEIHRSRCGAPTFIHLTFGNYNSTVRGWRTKLVRRVAILTLCLGDWNCIRSLNRRHSADLHNLYQILPRDNQGQELSQYKSRGNKRANHFPVFHCISFFSE